MILKAAEARQKQVLDADYDALDLNKYTHMETHLSSEQQAKLICSLQKYPKLFQPVHLELRHLNKGEKPYHAQPFPIPKSYVDTTKKDIKHLCNIGVLAKCNNPEWATPTLIQPRRTGGNVRVLTDFCVLTNKYTKRKPYPLPKIADLLQKLEGFAWATMLELSIPVIYVQ